MDEFSQYALAYYLGLRHHDQEDFGIKEALAELKSSGLNPSSAATLVYNVANLLDGKKYTRAMSVQVTDDYLTWILRDRGRPALRRSLEAVEQHILYYENKRNTRRPGLRELVVKHSAFLVGVPTASLLMEWKDRISSGFIDVLPLEWFEVEGILVGCVHEVRTPESGIVYAKCDVRVRKASADLDYAAYPQFNQSQELLLGTAQIEFGDADRTSISAISWKGIESEEFESCPFKEHGFELPPSEDYLAPNEPSAKIPRMVRGRPGQSKFRSNVRSIYSNRCCVTGCSLPAVLECAHIDAYIAPASDNTRNGLLLRCDIHALFDLHLIGIDPETFKIHVAPGADERGGYGEFGNRTLTLPRDLSHHPDKGALGRHWKIFKEKIQTKSH